jgi:hypothetical protein
MAYGKPPGPPVIVDDVDTLTPHQPGDTYFVSFNSPTQGGAGFDMPNPTPADISSEAFQALWPVLKDWDVNVPTHYSGYMGFNGSHMKIILNALVEAGIIPDPNAS